jgi:hypothetical protein
MAFQPIQPFLERRILRRRPEEAKIVPPDRGIWGMSAKMEILFKGATRPWIGTCEEYEQP